ncbi:MAG: hypothetical protein V4864_23000 [Pseudomonadota bacterium]
MRSALREPLVRLARSSALARAFASRPRDIPAQALLRHAAEHVHRIRMFRPLDSKASALLCDVPGDAAQLWSRYARSEAVHDRYYLRDLRAAGVTLGAGDAAFDTPLDATRRLGAFMADALRAYGPLPVVLYSFWAEENSEQGSPRIAARMRAVFGEDAAKGAAGHRQLDAAQGHAGLVSEVLDALIAGDSQLALAAGLLEAITGLIGDYFGALTAWSAAHGDWVPRAAATAEAA